jgi:HEPN domain-containing protein
VPERGDDWLKQAERDLAHSKMDLEHKFYEWACFSAQQAAEKSLKALLQKRGRAAWGHSVRELLEGIQGEFNIEGVIEGAKILDKYYIPARYPNGFDTGAPVDYFTQKEAKEAIVYADKIIRFCKDHIS